MSSWNCCPNGQSHQSNPIAGFGPGNKVPFFSSFISFTDPSLTTMQVYGNMFESGPELSGTWSVESQYCPTSDSCHTTWLNVTDAGREFVWIDATLETYYVANCTMLSSGLMTFSDMKLTTQNRQGVYQSRSIGWENYTPTSACNGITTIVSSAQVTIKHN